MVEAASFLSWSSIANQNRTQKAPNITYDGLYVAKAPACASFLLLIWMILDVMDVWRMWEAPGETQSPAACLPAPLPGTRRYKRHKQRLVMFMVSSVLASAHLHRTSTL